MKRDESFSKIRQKNYSVQKRPNKKTSGDLSFSIKQKFMDSNRKKKFNDDLIILNEPDVKINKTHRFRPQESIKFLQK